VIRIPRRRALNEVAGMLPGVTGREPGAFRVRLAMPLAWSQLRISSGPACSNERSSLDAKTTVTQGDDLNVREVCHGTSRPSASRLHLDRRHPAARVRRPRRVRPDLCGRDSSTLNDLEVTIEQVPQRSLLTIRLTNNEST